MSQVILFLQSQHDVTDFGYTENIKQNNGALSLLLPNLNNNIELMEKRLMYH